MIHGKERLHRFAMMLREARSLSSGGPNFDNQAVVKTWYQKLGHLPEDRVAKALNDLSGADFFPGASKIIDQATGKTGVQGAISAFDWVWNNLDERKAPTDLSILAGRTIDKMGGWAQCSRLWRDSQREKHGREFCRIYCDLEEKQLAGVFIGGSRLAIEAPESKKEGLSLTSIPDWKKRHIKMLEADVKENQKKSKSKMSLSDAISDLIGRRNFA